MSRDAEGRRMTYYVILQGDAACDYGIGCGVVFRVLNAGTHDDALDEVGKLVDEYETGKVKAAVILEVAFSNHDALGWIERRRKEAEERRKAEEERQRKKVEEDEAAAWDIVQSSAKADLEKHERAEYERLKLKYGGDGK